MRSNAAALLRGSDNPSLRSWACNDCRSGLHRSRDAEKRPAEIGSSTSTAPSSTSRRRGQVGAAESPGREKIRPRSACPCEPSRRDITWIRRETAESVRECQVIFYNPLTIAGAAAPIGDAEKRHSAPSSTDGEDRLVFESPGREKKIFPSRRDITWIRRETAESVRAWGAALETALDRGPDRANQGSSTVRQAIRMRGDAPVYRLGRRQTGKRQRGAASFQSRKLSTACKSRTNSAARLSCSCSM